MKTVSKGNKKGNYVRKKGLSKSLERRLSVVYRILAGVMAIMLFILLIITVIGLPEIGKAYNPDNNEVSERYIEKGLQETGAVNIVSGMILDYRAFDTFGESNVLFAATICVTIMLRLDAYRKEDEEDEEPQEEAEADRKDEKETDNKKLRLFRKLKRKKKSDETESDYDEEDGIEAVKRRTGRGVSRDRRVESLKKASFENIDSRYFEPEHDLILQKCCRIIVPVILVFGIYIVLNGHISPGGGFSGGAVLGAGFILYLSAFGFDKTERFMNATVIKWITFCSLMVYCLAKSYSFFTGANHLESGIPLGTPGAILSSGLILVLNICVGMVVACTMYSFYALVRRGRI